MSLGKRAFSKGSVTSKQFPVPVPESGGLQDTAFLSGLIYDIRVNIMFLLEQNIVVDDCLPLLSEMPTVFF